MQLPRANGILLHPTSLPSPYGVGELGSGARQFIDFLAETSQQFWQVLPLGPTAYGNSPYMCYSAIAGNPLLISVEVLHEDGLLSSEAIALMEHFPHDRVEYDQVAAAKMPLLRQAYAAFTVQGTPESQAAFEAFCQAKASWLDDYALFMALKTENQDISWFEWDEAIAHREPAAMKAALERLATEVHFHQFLQYEFFRQWGALKDYANERKIQIVGDIPIYVAHDSADVWANPENFKLDEKGLAAEMAGVPPDYFSETGQLWGNPVYDWEHLKDTNFAWWIQRFEALLTAVDWIRIDHFRGFEAYWSVPGGESTAMNGEWVLAPGEAFFKQLDKQLGHLPILAEDLGVITPEVEALRDQFEFPGMKVLHFAFGSDPANPFLPFNYPRNCVVYTGTHDNNTTVGWWGELQDWDKNNCLIHIGDVSPDGIQWDLIRQAMGSIANLSIIPMQDILSCGSEARMNTPGVATGNWTWRYEYDQLSGDVRHKLNTLTHRFGRPPQS
ncbi:4-alpha-glucanotransferase [filamentous cyanobacterium LEGE 11480]|uniref:4-alpha-glucanotransferase n=1 Tax=Romeriopsis navalis LEGE 11480 TaxID=2777977 RepID=A0A928Z2D9_9CYAN|nr:4-alpha-glucanotransferase [Romeriopsis navalis]MBE9028937.1 4-alpha-glucanotransferase [Romeriopsis navalis LEGE 11480]